MLIEVKKGYTEVRFINRCGINDEALLAEFYQTEDKVTLINEEFLKQNIRQHDTDIAICDNEYLIIKFNDEIVDKMRCKNGELIPLKYNRVYSEHLGKMSPRNTQQEFGFDMLQDPDTHIKLITGRFGSG